MLGFPKNIIQANAWTTSSSNVDVNLGLRYVTVECNTVDTDKNFDRYGKRSKVIITLPVTTQQSLNSSVTHYRDFTSEVAVVNGDHNVFEFTVGTNLGLRYVTVECNTVDTDKNFDRYGKRSKVIITLPVTTEQSLNSSVTHYRDFTSEVAVVNGDHNVFEFTVGTNLETVVNLKIMLELYLE